MINPNSLNVKEITADIYFKIEKEFISLMEKVDTGKTGRKTVGLAGLVGNTPDQITTKKEKLKRKERWNIKRKEPYTEIGVKRLPCVRCGKPATFQWQICSDGNNYRPICLECDIALNCLVLGFMNHPNAVELGNLYDEEQRVRYGKGITHVRSTK